MDLKEKQLLLADLCARLPYGVIVEIISYGQENLKPWVGKLYCKDLDCLIHDIAYKSVKPYLRPMSSMTDAEIKEIQKINWQFNFNKFDNSAYVSAADDGFCSVKQMDNILEYLNRHHFDYRGLIEKGLALEAPEGMYN